MPLTVEQSQLVKHVTQRGGPTLCVAVAGAGKTTAICASVQAMIAAGTNPQRILVATFSNPGCADMKARAARVGVPYGVSWRTLHSCGWSVIGEASSLGREGPDRRDPVVVDPRGENGWWVKQMLRDYLGRRARGQSDATQELIEKMAGTVFSEIGLASSYLIWPDEWTTSDGERFPGYSEWAITREREPADELTADITAGFYELWESVKAAPEEHDKQSPDPKKRTYPRPLLPDAGWTQRKPRKKVKWFSFDDQIAWPSRWALEGRPFMLRYRHAFTWVVVDEAQDNNLPQSVLSEWLAQPSTEGTPNVVFVGDDQQSIYAFRGAQPALLRLFRDKHVIEQIQFTANFRCAQKILDVGNNILSHAEDRLYEGDLLLGRTDERANGGTVTANECDDVVAEAALVIDGVQEAIAHGVSPDDISILYRLNSQSGPFELECIKRGILYRVATGAFFKRPEVRTITSFLKLATDNTDEEAWRRVTGSTVRGLGPAFLASHPTVISARRAGKLMSGWRRALKELLPHIDRVESFLAEGELGKAISYLSDDAGIRAHYRDRSASEEDETDVDVALNGLAECASSLDDVSMLLRFANADTGVVSSERQAEPRITLSTIHKSKGLEWEYVAAVGWSKGVFPFFKAPLAEERRLGYVCATRAKQYLHVSWVKTAANGQAAGMSALVDESRVRWVAASCGEPQWARTEQPDMEGTPTWGRPIGS